VEVIFAAKQLLPCDCQITATLPVGLVVVCPYDKANIFYISDCFHAHHEALFFWNSQLNFFFVNIAVFDFSSVLSTYIWLKRLDTHSQMFTFKADHSIIYIKSVFIENFGSMIQFITFYDAK